MKLTLDIPVVREAESSDAYPAPHLLAATFRKERRADRECFWVIHLNTCHQILKRDLVSVGTVRAALVRPREVFKRAITRSAASIITVHNHPSGSLTPSAEDLEIWARLNRAGEILGITVLDHLIITPSGNFYSHRAAS